MMEARRVSTHCYPLSPPTLESCQQAVRAKVVCVGRVPPLVEHTTYLVHPTLAMVALNPALVDLILVLLLF